MWETQLVCNKCGKPICSRCLVQTPVGARCRDCAKMSRLPTYQVKPLYYLKAIGAGMAAAVAIGILWKLVQGLIPFLYISLLIAGCRLCHLRVISLVTNRKRSTGLAVLAGVLFIVSYLVSALSFGGLHFHLFDIAAIVVGVFVSVSRLR